MEKKKTIKLIRLTLQDWKAQNVVVEFNPNGVTCISGRNGIGKTSIYNAWVWLLTGNINPYVNKNSDLYDNRKVLSPDTPTAIVKADVIINGEPYTIERRAKAKFTRKRGTDEYVKASSDEYTLLIDNIEWNIASFNEFIEKNICNPSLLPYVLNGEFFAVLVQRDKEQARKMLEDITGEIRIEDMTDADYTSLIERMRKFSIPQIKEQTANALVPLKKRAFEIPALIQQKQDLIAEYNQNDFDALEQSLIEKKSQIKALEARMVGYTEGYDKEIEERRAVITKKSDLQAKLASDKKAYDVELSDKIARIKEKIRDIAAQNKDIENDNLLAQARYNNYKSLYEKAKANVEMYTKRLETLHSQLVEIKQREFNGDHCQLCGAELTGTMLEDARAKFNKTKQADYDWNVQQGKSAKKMLDDSIKCCESYEAELNKGVQEKELISTQELEEDIERLKSTHVPYEMTDEYKVRAEEIDAIVIPDIPERGNIDAIGIERDKLQDEVDEINMALGLRNQVNKLENDVRELESEKRLVGNDIVSLERLQMLIKTYEEEKARRVSERINRHLDGCAFQMFRTQKDGQQVPDCVLLNGEGVVFSTTNYADKLSIYVQLQRLFLESYGIEIITFVDESFAFDTYHLPKKGIGEQIVYIRPSDDNFLNVSYK